jgi:hypothetical protein
VAIRRPRGIRPFAGRQGFRLSDRWPRVGGSPGIQAGGRGQRRRPGPEPTGSFRTGEEVDVTQFDATLNSRILDARRALDQACADGDDYHADIRLSELESLVRVAVEHGIRVDEAAQTLAAHGIATPYAGVPLLVDVREAPAAEPLV